MASRWTIAPSSEAVVDDVLRRLSDLALLDPATLTRGCAGADAQAMRQASAQDMADALREADQTVAMLIRGAPETAEQRREHSQRLVLAARVQQQAARVAALWRRWPE